MLTRTCPAGSGVNHEAVLMTLGTPSVLGGANRLLAILLSLWSYACSDNGATGAGRVVSHTGYPMLIEDRDRLANLQPLGFAEFGFRDFLRRDRLRYWDDSCGSASLVAWNDDRGAIETLFIPAATLCDELGVGC